MWFAHRRSFRVLGGEAQRISILYALISFVEGIVWYNLPIYFDATLNNLALVGVIIAGYSAASMLAGIPAGDLSDKMGRKTILMLGLVGSALSFLLLVFGWFEALLFAMMLYGVFSTFYLTSAFAHLLDMTTKRHEGRAIGVFETLQSLGWILGTLAGGVLLYALHLNTILSIAVLLILSMFFFTNAFMRGKFVFHWKRGFQHAARILTKDRVYFAELAAVRKLGAPALVLAAFSFLAGFWEWSVWMVEPIYAARLGESAITGSIVLAAILLPYMLVVYPAGKLADLIGIRKTVALGALIALASELLFLLYPSFPMLAVSMTLTTVGIAAMFVPISVFAKNITNKNRGQLVGYEETFYGFGGIVAPLTIGNIAQLTDFHTAFYVILALLILTGAYFYVHVREPARRQRNAASNS